MSRFRDDGVLQAEPCTYTKLWETCSIPESNAPVSGLLLGTYVSMTDEVIPNFREKQGQGKVFFNPMTRSTYVSSLIENGIHEAHRVTLLNCGGVPRQTIKRLDRTIVDTLYAQKNGLAFNTFPVPKWTTSASLLSEMVAEASTAALAQRGRPDNNLWESLAEIDQAFSMLPGALKECRKLIRNVALSKKGRKILQRGRTVTGQLAGPFKAASSLYLMYRYGLKPLLNDVNGILEGAKKKVGSLRMSARGQLQDSTMGTEDWNTYTANSTFYFRNSGNSVARVRAMSLDEYNVSALFNMGFGSKGLVTLPWELVPFSFVVDWFVNVGDYLSAVTPIFGAINLGNCVVTDIQDTMTVESLGQTPDFDWTLFSEDKGTLFSSRRVVQRTPGLLQPTILVKNSFRFEKITRSADALALLLQTMKFPHK